MEFAVEDLMLQVRVALDENSSSVALQELREVDTLTVDELIESKLVPAALVVQRDAPRHLLDAGEPFAGELRWESAVGIGRGELTLPEDFLRLVSFRMSDWRRDVTEAIYEDDPRYALQLSAFAGVRGCPEKPVVAIIQTAEGLALEVYSSTEGETVRVDRARYLPRPLIRNQKMRLCPRLREAVVHYAAFLTALTLGNEAQAKGLLEVSKTLMQ